MYTTFIQKLCVTNPDDKLFLADDKSHIYYKGVSYKITPIAIEKGQGDDTCCIGNTLRVCKVYYQRVTYYLDTNNCNFQILTIVYTRNSSMPRDKMMISYIMFDNGRFWKYN